MSTSEGKYELRKVSTSEGGWVSTRVKESEYK